jgi:hypothetical protein
METESKSRFDVESTEPICLENMTCVYCGALDVGIGTFDYDHVIGRKFVPKGTWQGSWSLQVRACKLCNGRKANLEDDISAITLYRALEYYPHDAELANLVLHKAEGSRSRRTGRPVVRSHEQFDVQGTLMGAANLTFGFASPPKSTEGGALNSRSCT